MAGWFRPGSHQAGGNRPDWLSQGSGCVVWVDRQAAGFGGEVALGQFRGIGKTLKVWPLTSFRSAAKKPLGSKMFKKTPLEKVPFIMGISMHIDQGAFV